MPSSGTLLCLASAAAFGAMGIFGKLAYDEGATVGTLLAVRFVLAAALFWVLVATTGAARHLRALAPRDLGLALALGGIGYSAQAADAARDRQQQPEQRGREREPDGEQRADARTLVVGELAEDPHRAERGGGGEAQEGACWGHAGSIADRPCRNDLDY